MRRKTTEERIKNERFMLISFAVLACVGAVFLAVTLFSALASLIDFSDGAFTALSSVALCAGCFAASFTAAKRRRRNGLLTGLICGGIIFAVLLLGGLIFVRSFTAGGFFSKMLIIVICSAIGGIMGVNRQT
ncbi:MAG: TIGR04086 family membrane protein [Ruminococcus sp.]|nr:TIGR04086 family membrane protein [Ruminococcus sp.]MCM1381545.1 TIGR04086 family membrane protein [Muribaculaceae bacterium]MCM1478783.1 TIGR04086 family membrane protein [Muribaculaceae bacterium]